MPHPFQLELYPDRVIRGDVYSCRAPQAEAAIVIYHGFKGFKDWGFFPYLADKLAERLNVVLFNGSRNGVGATLTQFDELEKFGQQTVSGELEDLHTVVQAIREGTLTAGGVAAGDPIFLLGHSRGGGVSAVYACDYPDHVKGVISWNGTSWFERMFSDEAIRLMKEGEQACVANARTGQQMPLDPVIWQDIEENRERFDIAERVKSMTVPLVLVQGTKDFAMLQKGSAAIAQANPNVKWVRVDGGDHTFGAKHPFAGSTAQLEQAIGASFEAVRTILGKTGV